MKTKSRTSSELVAELDAETRAARAPSEAQEGLEAAAFALATNPTPAAHDAHQNALAKVREIQAAQPEPEPITSAAVALARAATQADLNEAQRAFSEAAFTAASQQTPEARKALAEARSRTLALKDELAALDAAAAEANRRDRRAATQEVRDVLTALAAQADLAVDQVQPAWDRVCKAIDQLADAHNALKQATDAARVQVIRCSSVAITGSTLLTIPRIVQERMLATFGKELDVGDGVMSRSADYFPQAITGIVDQSRRLVRSGVQAKLEAAEGVQVEQAA